uniref:Uncharacterized protein n=1 Tax=Tanacetum cinerariifolium TaxID=118510 RepID=A0A6L2K7V7_TANCI|nr:hypothetical protein [Tanacetum cinerariifolium]
MEIVLTEMELILEQTQGGVSHEVSISAEGVEELKRKVKIKGEKKEALFTLKAETRSIHALSETLSYCLVLKTVVMEPMTQCKTLPSYLRSLNRVLFHFSRRLHTFLSSSHSELVGIEKMAVCSSLQSLKPKCTIESRAKRDHP